MRSVAALLARTEAATEAAARDPGVEATLELGDLDSRGRAHVGLVAVLCLVLIGGAAVISCLGAQLLVLHARAARSAS